MYIATFYSFKGGVGRSMALVNVAVQLAKRGKKVLLVDFDLEAPGLPTFNLAKPAAETLGVVDFVTRYIESGEAPDVRDFIYQSEQFSDGGGIWVMPVGYQDSEYSRRLNSIDWRKLYLEQDGYLLFEDLKEQWRTQIQPDYVLVDSRTGHSDVEGICTRQLPNAVCLLFFPNEQNLQGLKRIVANIRADNQRTPSRRIKLHFVVSNVPDLDDEDQILMRTMARFKQDLGYTDLAAEIHHYNSLSLLNQEIFSLRRPNSRLTAEYGRLVYAITRQNLEDRDAALGFLDDALRDLVSIMSEDGPSSLLDKVDTILKTFGQDGEICFRIALLYEQLGRSQDALNLLNSDIEGKLGTASFFATRARLNHRLAHKDDAVCDLRKMMECDGAELESILGVTPVIDQLAPDLYDILAESKAFQSLPVRDRLFFVLQSEGNEHQLKANISILRRLQNEDLSEMEIPQDAVNHALAMASIGAGEFKAARELFERCGQEAKMLEISHAFNLAMASWGESGSIPRELFEHVAALDQESRIRFEDSPNYQQCLAIAYATIGKREEATRCLEKARNSVRGTSGREFSAWTYSKVAPKEFLIHLDELEQFISGSGSGPRVFMRVS